MKYFLLIVFVILGYLKINAQCTNANSFGSAIAPTSGTVTISTCSYQIEYSTMSSVQAASIYQCSISDGSYITIHQGTFNGPVIASGISPLTWTSTVAGTYYAHWNTNANCGTATNCLTTTLTYVSAAFPCSGTPAPGNTICSLGAVVCPNATFSLSLQNPMLGSGITYQWYSSTDGITYTPINGANAGTYSTSISTPAYFYCSEDCSGTSINSTPVHLTIAPYTQCYCVPEYSTGTAFGDLISNVEIIGTTLSNNTGFVAGDTSYTYYTGQPNYTATLLPSASYSLSIATGEYGDQGYAAWIDYNDDGIFDISERIGHTNGTIGQGWTPGQVNDSSSFVISLTCNPPVGVHRLRVRGAFFTDGDQIDPCDLYGYGETEDYDITIAPPPACPSAGLVVSTNTTQSTATVSWLLTCSTASVFDLEYGPVGFTPGTGTFLNNQNVTISGDTATFTFSGLIDDTEYTFYYRANCGSDSSLWSAANNFRTLCGSITALGWCDGFDSDSQTEQCWTILNGNNDFSAWDMNTQFDQLNGDNCASISTDFNAGNNDDWLITPQLTLTGTEILYFNYKVISEFEPNDLKIKISTTGPNPANFTTTLLSLDTISNTLYQDTSVNLSAYSGNVYLAFHIPQGGLDGWVLYLDQICIQECVPSSISDDSIEICQTADSLDLNTVVNIGQSLGTWSFNQQPSALNGSVLQLNELVTGLYEINYLVNDACQSAAATAFVHLYEPSNAGVDSVAILCKAQPFDLFNALAGTPQTIGTWYDPANQPLPSSFIVTGNFPGQFNYDYIVTNGVCPSDSSNALIIVNNCIYIGVEEIISTLFSAYPNPTSGMLTIQIGNPEQPYSLEIHDLNGRVVYEHSEKLDKEGNYSINVQHLQTGMYYLFVLNDFEKQVVSIFKN